MKLIISILTVLLSLNAISKDDCMLTFKVGSVDTQESVCYVQGAKDDDKLKNLYASCECDKAKEDAGSTPADYAVAGASQCADDRYQANFGDGTSAGSVDLIKVKSE